MEYVVFDKSWAEVPKQDRPIGGLAVCPYQLFKAWQVIHVDPVTNEWLGLFRTKELAIRFAKTFESEPL